MGSTWEGIVDNMFNSKNIPELQLRAFCTYNVLKDRIYTEVLSDVLKVLDNEGVDVESDIWITVWGKLTSATIYLMTHAVLQYFKNKSGSADSFNGFVFNIFLKDFDERKETLMEYERDNTAFGHGQVIWAMGSQICKAINREDALLASKINLFWEQVAKVDREVTPRILKASPHELKEEMLKLNFVKMRKE